MVGVPTFPRRFFSVGQIYVSAKSKVEKPADLIGKKVGLHSFQTTLSVLAKGDFKREYGVPWQKIHWICMRPEIIEVDLGKDVKIEWLKPGQDVGMMMIKGEVDALMSPEPRRSMFDNPGTYRRLFRHGCVSGAFIVVQENGWFRISEKPSALALSKWIGTALRRKPQASAETALIPKR